MKYFLDTEFLEGKQDKRFLGIKVGETKPTIDLISIGIVDENGREYYAISKEFNLWEAWNRYDLKIEMVYGDIRNHFPEGIQHKIYWIRENVLYPIFYELFKKHNQMEPDSIYGNLNNFSGYMQRPENQKYAFKKFRSLLSIYGKTNKQIAEEVQDFCITYDSKKSVEENNPEFYAYYGDYDWVVFCWLFGKMINLPKGFPMYALDLKQIQDEIIKKSWKDVELSTWGHIGIENIKNVSGYPKQTDEHNALSDAKWNLKLYQFLNKIIMSNETNNQDNANNAPLQSQSETQQTPVEGNSTNSQTSTGSNSELQEHQLKVVDEFNELADKCKKLREFISSNGIFLTLSKEEQSARQAQLFHMEQYAGLLQSLINSWKNGNWNQSKGQSIIGDFGTGNEGVFTLKYLSALMIDATEVFGRDGRRNAIVATDMEKVQMMAVKSIFSK